MFCFKQCNKKRIQNSKDTSNGSKSTKDKKPLCKTCVANEVYKTNGDYYSASDLVQIINKTFTKCLESGDKLKSSARRKDRLWLERELTTSSRQNAPLSCRNKASNFNMQCSTTAGLDDGYSAGVKIVKKVLHFDFPQ